jgi:hypothetical protein
LHVAKPLELDHVGFNTAKIGRKLLFLSWAMSSGMTPSMAFAAHLIRSRRIWLTRRLSRSTVGKSVVSLEAPQNLSIGHAVGSFSAWLRPSRCSRMDSKIPS